MSAVTDRFSIIFPDDYDARRQYETPFKGYLGDVVVRLDDGQRFRLFFIDPARLRQELEEQAERGQPYFAEPNLIVLPEVNSDAIRRAVEGLVSEQFFRHLKPL